MSTADRSTPNPSQIRSARAGWAVPLKTTISRTRHTLPDRRRAGAAHAGQDSRSRCRSKSMMAVAAACGVLLWSVTVMSGAVGRS